MRSAGGSTVGISSAGTKMGLRRHGVPTGRLLGSHTLGDIGIHLHVDLRGSLSGHQVNLLKYIRIKYLIKSHCKGKRNLVRIKTMDRTINVAPKRQ